MRRHAPSGAGIASFIGTVVVLTLLGVAIHRTLSLPAALRGYTHQTAPAVQSLSGEVADVAASIDALRQRLERGSGSQASGTGTPAPPTAAELEAMQRRASRFKRRAAARAGQVAVVDTGAHPHRVSRDDSIFVSIASYRDEQCAPTIHDMYERAKSPHALFVGIVEQHDKEDEVCIPAQFRDPACQLKAFCPSDNIQTRRIEPKDARGPTYGRYIGMLMYRGEKYFLMIDSHNRFVTHWDDIVVSMYKRMGDRKVVFSHYPEAWNNPEDKPLVTNAPLDSRQSTTYLCTAKFVPDLGYVRLDGFVYPRANEPRPQAWAAAGFLFADAQVTRDCPFDPYLDYVFDGEEILYSARMWTHGWDIFSPGRNILYHYYYRAKAKKFWGLLPTNWLSRQAAAQRRIQWYLATVKKNTNERMVPLDTSEASVVVERQTFGLGKARTLEAWYEYAGIDKVKQTVKKKWC
jgi:UDP-GlcNAc:polypeptide alpha-N-acetylglucosaminyltransferase